MTDVPSRPFSTFYLEPSRNGLTRPKRVRGAGCKMVNMGEIFAHGRLRDVQMDRVPLQERDLSSVLQPGDLLFARQSLVLSGAGKCSIFLGDVEPVCFESHIIRVRLDQVKADPLFFYYLFQSPRGRSAIISIVEQGAGASGIRGSDLARLDLPAPALGIQKAVGALLGSLDDKIELNQRMNETLDAMAQAIFRDWFVDFGPVRRKMAGATDPVAIMGGLTPDPARAAELAALFPDALGDDDLPVGWWEESIYNFSSVIYGAPFASKRFNADKIGRPLIRIRDLPKHGSDLFTDEVHNREYVIQPGDIVVGMDGEFRARVWQGVPSLMNQRVCCFKPKSADARAFVYLSIKPILDRLEKSAVGTTVIHLGKGDVDRFTTIDPGEKLIRAFGGIVEAMLDRLVANGLENRTLAETRDYLLPRLMSGEVRVGDATLEIAA